MELIEGVALSHLCDYSFGDQSGQWGNIYTSFIKNANLANVEFVSKLFEIKKSRNYMTLFIDNIRLYKRHIVEVSESDRPYIDSLHAKNDLLRLCSNFLDMKFIIFTNLEDTPTDEYIFDAIPENVLCISAVNAVAHGGKVIPAPYGMQRKMTEKDNRIDILESYMKYAQPKKFKYLVYISHNEESNSERKGIKDLFDNTSWAKVDRHRVDYSTFLGTLWESKFMICPRGNAIDCHRNWEVLYMRRVPIMKRHPYLEELYKDLPALFVNDYSEVTEKLLIENDSLFQQAQKMNLISLTLPHFFDKIILKAPGDKLMAHNEQWIFCNQVKEKFPESFKNKKVLDIGSFDVNGNEEFLFENCEFFGLDLGEGPGVDIVCPAQEYDAPDESYETIISCECWEHNPFYKESIQNAIRILKSGGLFLFTCATTGRPIHGVKSLENYCKTKHEDWKTMPNVLRENWDNEYYKNLTEEDIRECVNVDELFSQYEFSIELNHCDLYFWGIKK